MPARTRDCIVAAFNRLINEKPFDEITVADIAREASVGKTTFYRYFKDRYDVMNFNYQRILDALLYDASVTTYRDCFYHLFVSGRRVLSKIQGAFASSGINSLEHFIFSYSRDILIRVTRANRQGAGLTESERLQADVFCYGVSYMYKNWIAGKYAVTADQAADKLFEMLPESLRYYEFSSEAFAYKAE
ncbi:MAG: TetR/AcrR family transcriptional regulator [Eggerthellaceae bacterium]|jgi:AcrR family transcriptional regulator